MGDANRGFTGLSKKAEIGWVEQIPYATITGGGSSTGATDSGTLVAE